MRLTWLCAIPLTLALYSPAAAQVSVTAEQVSTLVEHDTAHDPCKKFKMRVLMPSDVGAKPRSESPVGSPDPGIVWNPCRGDVIQFAAVPFIPTPGPGTSPAVPSLTPQSPPPVSEQVTVLGVQLPPAFVLMRRHR